METTNDAVATGMGIAALLTSLVIILAVYLFFCFCLKCICEKCGVKPGILVWIPLLNIIPMLEVAKMPVWMILLFLIPFVNVVMGIILWVKVCQARGKGVLAMIVTVIIPVIGIPYLAFSE